MGESIKHPPLQGPVFPVSYRYDSINGTGNLPEFTKIDADRFSEP